MLAVLWSEFTLVHALCWLCYGRDGRVFLHACALEDLADGRAVGQVYVNGIFIKVSGLKCYLECAYMCIYVRGGVCMVGFIIVWLVDYQRFVVLTCSGRTRRPSASAWIYDS